MAIKHIVVLGLNPFGESNGTKFLPTLGFSPSVAIGGPYAIAQAAIFVAGAVAGEVFTEGAEAAHTFIAGAVAGEVGP